MTGPISGNPPPDDLKSIYQQDFKESASLFQQSLQQYGHSSIPAQQAAFQDVMKKALNIMNETAKLALSKEAQKQEAKLNAQFQAFEQDPSSQNMANLNKTITKLQKDID
jgi:hypothetical protein